MNDDERDALREQYVALVKALAQFLSDVERQSVVTSDIDDVLLDIKYYMRADR